MSAPSAPNAQIEAAIAALEAQRAVLGDAVVEVALASLRLQLAALQPAPPAPPAEEGEHKLVTVMFADISGFSALSEQIGAERGEPNFMELAFDRATVRIVLQRGVVDEEPFGAVLVLLASDLIEIDRVIVVLGRIP